MVNYTNIGEILDLILLSRSKNRNMDKNEKNKNSHPEGMS